MSRYNVVTTYLSRNIFRTIKSIFLFQPVPATGLFVDINGCESINREKAWPAKRISFMRNPEYTLCAASVAAIIQLTHNSAFLIFKSTKLKTASVWW